MPVASFCTFVGAYMRHVKQMRVLRREGPAQSVCMVLLTFDSQEQVGRGRGCGVRGVEGIGDAAVGARAQWTVDVLIALAGRGLCVARSSGGHVAGGPAGAQGR